jgi:hypothetical protein
MILFLNCRTTYKHRRVIPAGWERGDAYELAGEDAEGFAICCRFVWTLEILSSIRASVISPSLVVSRITSKCI